MLTKDEEIFQIYSALEKICFEINDLFLAIDQLMNKRKYTPFSSLRWDMAESLWKPAQWLPYFSQRMYKKENDNSRAIGLNILMKDDTCRNIIPFMTVGIIKSDKDIPGASDAFYGAGWDDEEYGLVKFGNPIFSLTRSKTEHVEILSYFMKLTAVDTISNAEKLIVDPLDKIYNSLPGDWKNTNELEKVLEPIVEKIKNNMLTLEHIRGDAPLE